MFADQSALKELLIAARVASRGDIEVLERDAKENGLSLSERVLAEGLIGGDELRQLEAKAAGLPYIPTWDEPVPYRVLARIPEPVARAHNCIAFRETSAGLEVVGLSLSDLAATVEALGSDSRLLPRLGSERLVRKLLLSYQEAQRRGLGESLRFFGESIRQEKTEHDLAELTRLLFDNARLSRADLVHVSVTPKETLVRYRIGSRLYDAMATNPYIGNRLVEAAAHPDVFRQYEFEPVGHFDTNLSRRAVFSRRPQSTDVTLASVGLWGESQDIIRRVHRSGGLVVCGAANSIELKEFMYAVAAEAVDRGQSVLSLENKLERYLYHVEQVQLDSSPASLKDHLRRLLPQDFDIIMIENIDSPEAMTLAISAAARGMSVYVGVAAADTASLVGKVDELFSDRYILSSVCLAFMQLLPLRSLGADPVPVRLEDNELKDLKGFIDLGRIKDSLALAGLADETFDFSQQTYFSRRGGDSSAGRGLTYAAETIPINKITESLLKDGKAPADIIRLARAGGALSLAESIFAAAVLGRADINEAIAAIRRRY